MTSQLPTDSVRFSLTSVTAWLLTGALLPVAGAFVSMAAFKQINPADAYADLWQSLVWIIVILGCFVPPFLHGWAVKKVVPDSSIFFWGIALLASGALWLFFMFSAQGFSQHDLERPFTAAANRAASLGMQFEALFTLPWWRPTIVSAINGAVLSVLPALYLSRLNLKRFLTIWGSLLLGMVTFDLILRFYNLMQYSAFHHVGPLLNNTPWPARIAEISMRAMAAMTAASLSLIGLFLVFKTNDRKTARNRCVVLSIVAVVTVLIVPATAYVMGPSGVHRGFPKVQNTLSVAPKTDQSSGHLVIAFNHSVDLEPLSRLNSGFARLFFSPNGAEFAMITNDGRIAIVDTASGRTLTIFGQSIGDPLSRAHTLRQSIVWLNNERLLHVRNFRKPIGEPRERRFHVETELNVYAQGATSWESGQQSANLDLTVFGCEELKSSSPLRLLDGSVWVLCQPKQRGDGSPYALRIDLESFDLVQSIENADEDGLGNHRGFVQIGQTSWLAFKGHTGLSLVPITEGTNELFIEKAEWSIASRASDLTFQGFSPSTELLELVFCGNVENLSNPPQETTKAAWGPSTCRFLQYDPQDGSYVGYYDGPERRVRKKPRKLVEKSVTTESGLKFRSLWKETSKTGTIEVIDVIADEVMQSVETKAQSAVAVSPDENWLFTMGVFDHQLRAYRISETAVAE